jgi:flagellar protein FlgJ
MAIGKIGSADSVSAGSASSSRERTELARENQLDPRYAARQAAAPARDPRVDEVSKMYEKQFLHEMVKAMRGTVSESEFMKTSQAEKIYRDQLDDQYVEAWGDNGGLGFQKVIYDQIMSRYFGKSAGEAESLRKQGPIQLSDRDITKVARMDAQGGRPGQVPMKVELAKQATGDGASQIKAPWEGKLLTQTRLPDGKNAVVMEHRPGLRSTFIFDGVLTSVQPGDQIEKGKAIGLLSPEIGSFFWNLDGNSKSGSDLK